MHTHKLTNLYTHTQTYTHAHTHTHTHTQLSGDTMNTSARMESTGELNKQGLISGSPKGVKGDFEGCHEALPALFSLFFCCHSCYSYHDLRPDLPFQARTLGLLGRSSTKRTNTFKFKVARMVETQNLKPKPRATRSARLHPHSHSSRVPTMPSCTTKLYQKLCTHSNSMMCPTR